MIDSQHVQFWSEGASVAGWWRTPSAGNEPWPAVVHGPGWFGSKDAAVYERYHEYLSAAGLGVLVIDYRGFGDTEGTSGYFSPWDQVTDLINAVTYLETRSDVDAGRIGAFGTGATGGGNVVMLAAADSRVMASVAQFPIADGARWLREMRTDEEWDSFLERLAEDRRKRVESGQGESVDPHRDVMVAPPERSERRFKQDLRGRVPHRTSLSAADALLRYRPVDLAPRVESPVLFIAVEGDEATPETHAVALHDAVTGPKKLMIQRQTSHYALYEDRAGVVLHAIASWYEKYLGIQERHDE